MLNNQRKICLRLVGGVGNQLFCYSYARSLAEQTGRQLSIDTTTGFLKDEYNRTPRLKSFLKNYVECSWFEKLILLFSKKYSKKSMSLFNAMYWKEPDPKSFRKLDTISFASVDLLFLEGYFQSYLYFKDNIELIKSDIQISIQVSLAINELYDLISSCNSVAVHIRRVAYDNLLGIDYYQDAIALIKQQIDSPCFFFFSDDIEWCKENFSYLRSSIFVEHDSKDEMVDLWLMTQCKNHIIANSSFSWWGAWLATNPEKLTIGPAEPSIGVDNMFYPEDWIIIK